ncbi:hypothetical protein LguiA_022259 [Lonicera macranthoides]
MAKLSLKRAEQLSRFLSVTSICHGSQTKQKLGLCNSILNNLHLKRLNYERSYCYILDLKIEIDGYTFYAAFERSTDKEKIKYMAVTASGVYKHCKSCFGLSNHSQNRNYAVSKTGLSVTATAYTSSALPLMDFMALLSPVLASVYTDLNADFQWNVAKLASYDARINLTFFSLTLEGGTPGAKIRSETLAEINVITDASGEGFKD